MWNHKEISKKLEEFSNIYENRPIKYNHGGGHSPHYFALWFIIKQLNPSYVIESGVYKGQSTWIIEQCCKDIHSIDLNLGPREYISNNARYYDKDFSTIKWKNTENALVFFDDHVNHLERIKQCKNFGFKHIIFDDNYPIGKGDLNTIKQVIDWGGKIKEIKNYFEFPPVYRDQITRWGNKWDYPTKKPLLSECKEDWQKCYSEERQQYTWICYIELS